VANCVLLVVLRHAHSSCHVLLAGDFNTDSQIKCSASSAVKNFISRNKLYQYDILFPSACRNTYVNDSTHHTSTIDYILTSNADSVVAFNILDIDINFSDHLPFMAVCKTDIESELVNELSLPTEFTNLRWDYARTDLYYEHSRVLLQPVLDDLDNIIEHLNERHSLICHIDHVYKRVVDYLVNCANMFIYKK